jgi:hypothetical protein
VFGDLWEKIKTLLTGGTVEVRLFTKFIKESFAEMHKKMKVAEAFFGTAGYLNIYKNSGVEDKPESHDEFTSRERSQWTLRAQHVHPELHLFWSWTFCEMQKMIKF